MLFVFQMGKWQQYVFSHGPNRAYGKWSEQDMDNAIADVKDGVDINRSTHGNRVPKATLLRQLYHKNVHVNASKKHPGRCADLPKSVESERMLAEINLCITFIDLCIVQYTRFLYRKFPN